MIASLAMYDWPGQSLYWDRFWYAIRDALRHVGLPAPDDRTTDGTLSDHWVNPDLILGQTCGLPFKSHLHSQVHLVGTLDHSLPGCPPGYYNSVLVRRSGERDLSGGTLAINARDSQSGWAAPLLHAEKNGWKFKQMIETGSHHASAISVADGHADMAGIDAETWRLLERYDPGLAARLTIIARTDPTPGLPLITAARFPPRDVFDAVTRALAQVPQDTRLALNIRGILPISAQTYLNVPAPRAA